MHILDTQLCTEGGADMGSQVDMGTCTDACTHSKQGVGPEDNQVYPKIDLHFVTIFEVSMGAGQCHLALQHLH